MPEMPPTEIRKRDGSIQSFDPSKIASAILKAQRAAGHADAGVAEAMARHTVERLEQRFAGRTPSVEDVQNAVEEVLLQEGHPEVAKAYILYRRQRAAVREAKEIFGVRDDLKLTVNAVKVLERRYLRKDDQGRVIETPRGMLRRVARAVAAPDAQWGSAADVERTEEEFSRTMLDLEFLPNSPTLMNAGTDLGQLSACFVLPVEDSMEGIFEAVKQMALVHQSGGGTGFSFSRLRPKMDVVRSTGGIASGPVSFMRVFDEATEVIKQGGRRRGANMGILRVDHPDIQEFVTCKTHGARFTNFNISVAVTEAFMEAARTDDLYDLVNPRSGKVVRRVGARDIFDLIVQSAWMTGDPGLIFLDEINRYNPTPQLGPIESTNPCGEQPLLPNESCILGSINLVAMLRDGALDWERLRVTIRTAVHFLDNVIDCNDYPTEEIRRLTLANRKIGLGVMGFAEMLIHCGIPYDAPEALAMAERLVRFITEEGHAASRELARVRGSFPNFPGSLWERQAYDALRNATVTTIAPTGTISLIAGVSSGIEPLFALSYVRNVLEGTRLLERNPHFEKVARDRGFFSEDLMARIAQRGTIRDLEEIPADVRHLFVTAFDIAPDWHVRLQAAFQKHTDNAVSKTVNLPESATQRDVRRVYLLAHELKCKGITIYRYGSHGTPVLEVDSEYTGECRTCAQ